MVGTPPRIQRNTPSNCYAAGGMPLAFTQEDFLVFSCYAAVHISVTNRLFHKRNVTCTKCHQYFLIPISLYQYNPVSSWSNRPLLSGGDSSCSWVFCLCTGPKGESYTQLEGWQSVSPVAITLIWNRVHSRGYSHERTQTSSFSCKVY